MLSINPVAFFRQATTKLFIKPTGATNFIDLGQVSGTAFNQNPTAVEIVESAKGYKHVTRELIGQIKHTYELTVSEMTPEVLELVNLANAGADTVQAAIAAPTGTATFTLVKLREMLNLGKRDVISVVVKNFDNSITYTVDTDYILDAGAGYIQIKSGGAIAAGATLNVTFGCNVLTRTRIEALKKVYTAGDVLIMAFDQHSEIPIEEHSFTGQYKVTDRGTDDGTKIREVKLMVIASTKPIVTVRQS